MNTATRDGDVIAWPTTPRTIRQRLTTWRDRMFGPDPTGADATWADQLRHTVDQIDDDTSTGRHYADNIATTLLARPVAIAAVPYRLVDDPIFGELPIGPLEPAHIHDQLMGTER